MKLRRVVLFSVAILSCAVMLILFTISPRGSSSPLLTILTTSPRFWFAPPTNWLCLVRGPVYTNSVVTLTLSNAGPRPLSFKSGWLVQARIYSSGGATQGLVYMPGGATAYLDPGATTNLSLRTVFPRTGLDLDFRWSEERTRSRMWVDRLHLQMAVMLGRPFPNRALLAEGTLRTQIAPVSKAQADGSAGRRQSVRQETNQPSAAVGSGR